MSDLFYVFGISLTVLALVVSFVGLRREGFPRSSGVMAGGLAIMAVLVVASCAYAVVLAQEEAEHREHELAEAADAEHSGQEEASGQQGEDEGAPATEGSEPLESEPGPAETLELTSPEDGALTFEPEALEASAGEVEIVYTNPSAVPHDVAIESDGETLSQGPTVTSGDTSTATAQLDPGQYVFYCGVPGHREAGMEGVLRVSR